MFVREILYYFDLMEINNYVIINIDYKHGCHKSGKTGILGNVRVS